MRTWLITGVSSGFGCAEELSEEDINKILATNLTASIKDNTALILRRTCCKTDAGVRLDPAKGLAPGDPAKMASRIIESTGKVPAPLRMVLGSQALPDF